MFADVCKIASFLDAGLRKREADFYPRSADAGWPRVSGCFRLLCGAPIARTGLFHAAPRLTASAEAFSPPVELTAPDTIALDTDGLERLYGSLHDIAAIACRAALQRADALSVRDAYSYSSVLIGDSVWG
jgi:hypothetical protein